MTRTEIPGRALELTIYSWVTQGESFVEQCFTMYYFDRYKERVRTGSRQYTGRVFMREDLDHPPPLPFRLPKDPNDVA